MDYRLYPLGENALTIEFGNKLSIETNDLVINLTKQIERNNFQGFVECVPAYSSLTVFYDLYQVRKNNSKFKTAYEFVKTHIINNLQHLTETEKGKQNTIEIPMSFKKEFAIDLEFVAKTNNLTRKKVIEIFLSRIYRVFMIGFLPGFAYMGELDKKIATPRKQNPRTKVPKGSVGIAGTQTGIYPLESPGGWQIIGRTETELFTPNGKSPTLFQAGDFVKFIQI